MRVHFVSGFTCKYLFVKQIYTQQQGAEDWGRVACNSGVNRSERNAFSIDTTLTSRQIQNVE